MELKKTKQPIMGLAALLIVLFHLFPASRSNDVLSSVVRYIVMTGYIGVDIFFFMTGYMAHFSNTDNYFQYIKRKFLNIYPIFIFSCVLLVIMGKLSVKKALYTVLGVDLFLSGGGSFLWFIPAIMIFYLLVPFYKLIKKIGSVQTFAVSITMWAVLVFALEKILTNHSANIFLCRIPIILLGTMLAVYEGEWKHRYKLIVGVFLVAIGTFLTCKFGYMIKADFFAKDIFYVIVIPNIIGIILLADIIFGKVKTFVFEGLGKISLELFCLQMVFGSLLFGKVIKYISNSKLAFLVVFVLLIVLSGLMHTEKKIIKR